MMRRLRYWYHETIAAVKGCWFAIRMGLRECMEIATAPWRAIRSTGVGGVAHGVRASGREVAGNMRDFLRSIGRFLLACVSFVVYLPYRCYRLIVYGPRTAWVTLRSMPPRLILLVAAVSLTVVGAVGATGGYLLWEHRREFQRTLYYKHLDYQMANCDLEGVEKTLEHLQTINGDDPTLAARLAGIRAREAPVNDPTLLRVVMRSHFVKGDMRLAAREAAKLIETVPLDWEARCMLADDASRRDDPSDVQKHLAVLPRPAESAESIQVWTAWYAATLFLRLGETERFEEMADFMILNVLPLLRSKETVLWEHDAKLLLLDCYRMAMFQLDKRKRLTQYWEPVQRVCRSILDADKKADARQLMNLAAAQQLHLEHLKEFQRRRLITDADHKAFAAEVEDRIRIACERTIVLDAKSVQAYVRLAEHFLRVGDVDRAFETIEGSFRACGDEQDLIATKAQLLQKTVPLEALRYLDGLYQIDSLNEKMCQVYAVVAYSAGRPDKALEACRRAQKLHPGWPWAHRFEAEICLLLGRTTEAAAALQPIKSQLANDPAGCELYVRTLCNCGSFALAEEFLQQIAAENRPVDALLHAAAAFFSQKRYEDAVRWARIALERDATNAAALIIVGDGMQALAEIDARTWDRDKVREALRAYRAVQRQQPDNWLVVNNIVWLELKGLDQPQQAYESSEPLRGIQNRVSLPAEYLDTLGEVYIAVGRFEQARQVLDDAIRAAGPRAAYLTHLALAHHGLNQPELAERHLVQASEISHKSPREAAELADAIRQINEKK